MEEAVFIFVFGLMSLFYCSKMAFKEDKTFSFFIALSLGIILTVTGINMFYECKSELNLETEEWRDYDL
jgi:Kef-type K+ transport system membrane component KefB